MKEEFEFGQIVEIKLPYSGWTLGRYCGQNSSGTNHYVRLNGDGTIRAAKESWEIRKASAPVQTSMLNLWTVVNDDPDTYTTPEDAVVGAEEAARLTPGKRMYVVQYPKRHCIFPPVKPTWHE